MTICTAPETAVAHSRAVLAIVLVAYFVVLEPHLALVAHVARALAGSAALLAVDAAYHAKYDTYGANIVGTVVGPDAAAVTIRLDPLR